MEIPVQHKLDQRPARSCQLCFVRCTSVGECLLCRTHSQSLQQHSRDMSPCDVGPVPPTPHLVPNTLQPPIFSLFLTFVSFRTGNVNLLNCYYYFQSLFNWPTFPVLLQIKPGPMGEAFQIATADYCRPDVLLVAWPTAPKRWYFWHMILQKLL